AVEDDAVEDDAVEDDAVEDDAVEDDAVEDDAVEDDAVEDDAVEDDRSEIVRAALAAANAPDDAPETTGDPIPRSIYAEIDALIAEQRQTAPAAPPPAADEEPVLDLDAWDEFDAVFDDPTPAEAPPPAAPPGIDDLDRLIEELESARIVPDPAFEDVPALDDDPDDPLEDMVSETLARIYASQEKYAEAARVYEQLARQHPERADAFAARAEEMRGLAGEA
ncbi:MAG: hypothetical protein R3247_11145, partial [Rhodothermales bacterium]|nr:hypothetical protein [Rhodothermales bacterium]